MSYNENLVGEQTIPKNYVYHKTRKCNRLSILEYGLKTSIGSSYEHISKKYTNDITPAVFVNNTDDYDDGWCKKFDFDIFKINTRILDNIWFVDKHMKGGGDKYLITFKDIPSYAIKLIHSGKF
jgi:hypothetical protein